MQNSRIDFPDVGVWLALAIENHPHHPRAQRYWHEEAANQSAFCRVTAAGLVRLITNSAVMGGSPLSVWEAWAAYQSLRSIPEITLLPEPEGVEPLLGEWAIAARFPARMWTDAYLAAFACAANLRLITLDGDFHRFSELNVLHLRDANA